MQNYRIGVNQRLLCIYELLDAHFGNLHWWPGDSPFEVIVGAILTQNTTWRNVEKAIVNLKSNGILSPEAILMTGDHILSDLIRPSGYHRVKTRRLKSFVRYLYENYNGSLDAMFLEDLQTLRKNLLVINGIGEETADSILLYAGEKLIFVVDSYTRRILERHGIVFKGDAYADIQNLFMNHLPRSVSLYKQYHALLVNTGKFFCKNPPRCEGCPLKALMTTSTNGLD
jgi:endonuclease-3 related protein